MNYVKSIACKPHFYKKTWWLLVNSPPPRDYGRAPGERENNRVNTPERQVLTGESVFLSSHRGIYPPRLIFTALCSSQLNSLGTFGCSCLWEIRGENFKVTAGKYGNWLKFRVNRSQVPHRHLGLWKFPWGTSGMPLKNFTMCLPT